MVRYTNPWEMMKAEWEMMKTCLEAFFTKVKAQVNTRLAAMNPGFAHEAGKDNKKEGQHHWGDD